ncbi:ubiquitin carboxyl-terminal hydrolase, putative [Babesia bigemina]|uniref:Ubiquitin carboxyl-terminal hydrolase, putative n=1 Tax=Babesia bigemina TaxID=5866 RepID=A0A061DBH3_BABBI|nr:ubiquitin carboxyl-terminal hydrolase, putative [Babesia bigemina]CDR98056.1 ubiquitin carboxyl-terminal hydrolase, putative [Babesia bigemina]|eukprot:XP_012770242.1 ubiquitin carboxyl-terminal hydrolase, putative [Babesia bigemina]
MHWYVDQEAPDRMPPISANEVELVVSDFRGKVIEPLSRLLKEGDPNEEIRRLQNLTVFSEWKDIPNFRFRIMFFPVSPQPEGDSGIQEYHISAYVEGTAKDDWPENWVCYSTRFCVIVLNHKDVHLSVYKADSFNFSSSEADRGWQGILTHTQLVDGGFLNENGDLVLRAGVYPIGAEVNRAAREHGYDCRKATGFVGLQNHGATCYMNALLQSLYSITKFRKAVYSLNFRVDEMIGEQSYEIMKRLQSEMRDCHPSEVQSNNGYKNSKRKSHEHSEFNNEDNEGSADNSDLFVDSNMDERDCRAILMEEEEEQKKVPSVGLALQNLFYKLRYAQHAPPCKELMRSFGWDSSDMFTQQDSHELLKLLLDKMEEQMKGTPVEGSVKQMFEGEMETYIECIDIDYKSSRMETFEDIQLDIQGCSDIYDSLKKLTEAEILSGDNMYEAEGHGKQRARKGIRFLKFPPVCVFLLKRFTFDLQRMDTVKLNDRFEFYKEIDLSPFCPTGGQYVLQAVSVHHGSINSGHYYAFAASDKRQWHRFDDENVAKVSEYAVIGDNFGGEEPDCYNYCSAENESSPRPSRRTKNYNAYILIYVLKSAAGDILGDCDPVSEGYSMITRCCMQDRLAAMRHRVRERLSQSIKVKVFEKSDFEGLKFMDQPFMGWLGGKVITFDRSTVLSEALKRIGNMFAKPDTDVYAGPENFHVMGINRSTHRFCCLAEVRGHQEVSDDTLQSIVSQIRHDVFQVYDPTLYILYVPRPMHCASIQSSSLFFIKYFDIFSENPDGERLICIDVVYLSPEGTILQVAGPALCKLARFMTEGLITPYHVSAIERCVSRIGSVDMSSKSVREMDAILNQILHEESLHLNWYVEQSGLYEAVALNKTLKEQHLGNGDLLVFNFRPTESMRRLVEEIDTKFTLKEDFVETRPVLEGALSGPLFHVSADYLQSGEAPGASISPHTIAFRDMRARWESFAATEILKYQSVNMFPIYDFPSFIDWRLNVVTITFELYNPFEQLGAWVNCCGSIVKAVGSVDDPSPKSFEESPKVAGPLKTVQFTLDLRVPCKHALRYVCWSMGVDPAHVLFYAHQPHKLESIWMRPASIDDFCHRDGSLGFVQKPLSNLFTALGKAVRHDNANRDAVMRSGSINSNAQCSDHSVDSACQTDISAASGTGNANGIGNVLALPNRTISGSDTGILDSGRDTGREEMMGGVPLANSLNSRFEGGSNKPNVIYMAVFPQCYSDLTVKCDGVSLNFVVQVFNRRVECTGVCMGKAPAGITVGEVCDMVVRIANLGPNVRMRMVECLSDSFVVVEPSGLMRDLPHYVNTNIRNILAAPIRVEPDWSYEEQESLKNGERVLLTVMHQTPDHETFGHPFQVLVHPRWTLGEIKGAIREKLCLPKREWDRWSFFQQMDGYNRAWKANDDCLDWDKSSDIKLLAEHPKPYDKSRSFSAMRIA